MKAEAAISRGATGHDALSGAIAALPILREGVSIELALLFASDTYASEFPALLAELRKVCGAATIIGCSGQGVIGPKHEIEDEPAVALQVFSLPGANLRTLRLDASDLEVDPRELWDERVPGLDVADVSALMVFADPFSLDGEDLLAFLSNLRDGLPLIGGLASGDVRRRATYLFLDDKVYDDGAIALALSGPFDVQTIVAQGATPIGETWTITEVEGNVVRTIGMRPAYEVLMETFGSLEPMMQRRARRNLLVGLAIDEYRDELGRGDFLIRNLMGVDQASGAIAIGAMPRVGQTIQFQLRDPDAADIDMREMLRQARAGREDEEVVGALLCSCNGRGMGLFRIPDHDALALSQMLGNIPVAGFFCNGEIGPVGGQNFLHGFTASIALITAKGSGQRTRQDVTEASEEVLGL